MKHLGPSYIVFMEEGITLLIDIDECSTTKNKGLISVGCDEW